MNERLHVLALQAFGSTIDTDPILVYEVEKFGQLIIKEVSAQPKVYLLNKLDAYESDATWELHGWTNDLKLAQQWREKSSRHERHDFTDLFFVKKIETLE